MDTLIYAIAKIIVLNFGLGALFTFCLLNSEQVARASEPENTLNQGVKGKPDWNRLVQGFRRGHQLLGGIEYGQTDWVGSIPLGAAEDSFGLSSQGYLAKVQYSFQMEVLGSFGYSLGTLAAAPVYNSIDQKSTDISYVDLPGITVSLIYNFSPIWQLSTELSGNLRRFRSFTLNTGQSAVFTGRTSRFSLDLDYFFSLEHALRLQLGAGKITYRDSNDVDVQGNFRFLSIGIVQHLI